MPLSTAWIDAFLSRERLPPQFRALITEVHAPIAARLAAEARRRGGHLAAGLCGAQGSGKSTLAAVLKGLLENAGLPTAVLSIDDLYLTRAERLRLGEHVHPLLRTRGVPGTHDVSLGLATLQRLRSVGPVALPRFDKQRDDRLPQAQWPMFDAPASVVILEGWCVGALPQTAAELSAPVNTLERTEDPRGEWRGYANDALRGAYHELFGRLDMLMLLEAPSFDVVHGWRLEQEHKLRDRVTAAGGDVSRVMDDAGVARFISHYERITRHILREMPGRADIVLELAAHRAPLRLRGA